MTETPRTAVNPEAVASLCRAIIGRRFEAAEAVVPGDGIREFCNVIGETGLLHLDAEVARKAGYRDIVAPPTYVFVVKFSVMHPANVMQEVGLEGSAGKLLHAEQTFEYHAPVCAGDRLRFEERVADAYEKRNGSLIFVILETRVTNQLGELAVTIRHTEVVRMEA